jgi:hypothetical protein
MNLLRLLKALLVGLTGLFIVITLFSLIIPSTVRVSRATVITNVSPAEVYRQVADLKNWKNWHPVFKTDSAVVTFTDTSNKACDIEYNGSTTHLSIVSLEPAAIKLDLRSKKQNEILVEVHLTNLPDQQSVQVEWRALNRLSWYPWEKFYGIFLDKLSGPGYEAALTGLKEFLESH